MGTFIAVFSMFFAMISLMAVGVIMHRKPIAGSCGGLGGVGVEKACDCDKPCESRLERLAQTEQEVIFQKK